jgi:hypothetical protein
MYFVLALGGVLAERCFAAGQAPQLFDLILDVVVALSAVSTRETDWVG